MTICYIGITVVEPEWLPVFTGNRCTFSDPLTDPAPQYDTDKGQVVCYRTSTLGRYTTPSKHGILPQCWVIVGLALLMVTQY